MRKASPPSAPWPSSANSNRRRAASSRSNASARQRFRVRTTELQKHGLWVAEVEAVIEDVALEIPDDLQHTATALRRLVDTLEERRRAQGAETVRLPIGEPYRFDDCGWVANRWCELVPMQLELRQRLMELDSPLMRLELVSDLLARTGITE
jgi:Lon protease-like protein